MKSVQKLSFLASCQREVQQYWSKWSRRKVRGAHRVVLRVQNSWRDELQPIRVPTNDLFHSSACLAKQWRQILRNSTVSQVILRLDFSRNPSTCCTLLTKVTIGRQITNILWFILKPYTRFEMNKEQMIFLKVRAWKLGTTKLGYKYCSSFKILFLLKHLNCKWYVNHLYFDLVEKKGHLT